MPNAHEFPRLDAKSKTYPEEDKTAIKTLGCKIAFADLSFVTPDVFIASWRLVSGL